MWESKEFFHWHRAVRWGGRLSRHVLRQIFFCCLIPSLSWNTQQKKPRSFSFSSYTIGSSLSLSHSFSLSLKPSRPEALKKVFQAYKVDKSSSSSGSRFIQGTRFSRKDWPRHPWPAGQPAFSLPCARFSSVWSLFSSLGRGKKCQSIQKSQCVHFHFSFCSIYIRFWFVHLSPRVNMQSFSVLFLYLLFTWYCALRCEKYIGKK